MNHTKIVFFNQYLDQVGAVQPKSLPIQPSSQEWSASHVSSVAHPGALRRLDHPDLMGALVAVPDRDDDRSRNPSDTRSSLGSQPKRVRNSASFSSRQRMAAEKRKCVRTSIMSKTAHVGPRKLLVRHLQLGSPNSESWGVTVVRRESPASTGGSELICSKPALT